MANSSYSMATLEDEDWEIPPPRPPVTLVLVGRTGNGKSATGNSILGERAFKSKLSASAVTETTQLKSSVLPDGRVVNVVDTPGLFDPKTPLHFVGEEIVKCIELAKDGIHGILLVLSIRNRFTAEEFDAIEGLQALFGPKILDYMIVVFTGGDELAENDEDLDTYLSSSVPAKLTDFLKKCNGRQVLFDNKTDDQFKKSRQANELLIMVDKVLEDNHGQPYSNNLFKEAKDRATQLVKREEEAQSKQGFRNEELAKLKEDMEMAHKEQLRAVVALLEERLRVHTEELQNHLNEERAAREKVELYARQAKEKADEDIRSLRAELEGAREELSRRSSPTCNIL